MADVRLVDLDVFKRYSLAIRQETAPAEELLAVLEATRRQIEENDRPAGRFARRRRDGAGARPEVELPTDDEPGSDEDYAP